MDILLLLGGVTPKEYAPLKKEMRARGMKPLVIKVPQQLRQKEIVRKKACSIVLDEHPELVLQLAEYTLGIGLGAEWRRDAIISTLNSLIGERLAKIRLQILADTLGSAEPSDIKAVIERGYSGSNYDYLHWDGTFMSWLETVAQKEIPVFEVVDESVYLQSWYPDHGFEILDD